MTVSKVVAVLESLPQGQWIPLGDVASMLGVRERALRASGGEESLVELASHLLFQRVGAVAVTRTAPRPAGIIVTTDPATLRACERTIRRHAERELKKAGALRRWAEEFEESVVLYPLPGQQLDAFKEVEE